MAVIKQVVGTRFIASATAKVRSRFIASANTVMALLLLVLGTACGDATRDKVLMVSVEPQRALLEEIAGDRYDVQTVLTPGSNPETFEPGMQTRRNLETAAAYFTTGQLPFEHALEDVLPDGVRVVDTSAGIDLVYGTHDHGHDHGDHDHGGADPHVWTSVKNARIMARNMYDGLVELDPEGRDYYTERFDRLDARLDSLDRAFAAQVAASDAPKAFAIWHPSLSYLARDYGLEQVAVGYENKEMPAGTLREVIEEAREHGVRVFFFQQEFDSRQAETLNKEMGTELITINPLDYGWQKQIEQIVSALCR